MCIYKHKKIKSQFYNYKTAKDINSKHHKLILKKELQSFSAVEMYKHTRTHTIYKYLLCDVTPWSLQVIVAPEVCKISCNY